MIDQRMLEPDNATPEQYGWSFTPDGNTHDFAIKNICAYVGPAMLYDSALNHNYYSIVVHEKERVDEIRSTFQKIEFTDDDFLPCTKLNFYDKSKLVRKYEEAMSK